MCYNNDYYKFNYHTNMKKKYLSILMGVLVAVGLFSTTNFADASRLTQNQVQAVINLLKAFGAPSSTIANVRSALTGDTNPSHSNYSGTGYVQNSQFCPHLYRNLYIGINAPDVSQLQHFLKSKGFYTFPKITGYYGHATERAVKAFQKAYGVVTFGTPNTTGYGVVGNRTREAINRLCQNKYVNNQVQSVNKNEPWMLKELPGKLSFAKVKLPTSAWNNGKLSLDYVYTTKVDGITVVISASLDDAESALEKARSVASKVAVLLLSADKRFKEMGLSGDL